MIILKKDFLDPLKGHLVYAIKKGDEFLYIGRTCRGICRILDHGHLNSKTAMEDYTHVEIMPCNTENESKSLEINMIRDHNPVLNNNSVKKGQYRRRSFFQDAGRRIGDCAVEPKTEDYWDRLRRR